MEAIILKDTKRRLLMKRQLKTILCLMLAVMMFSGCINKPSVDPEAAVSFFLKAALNGEFEEYAELIGEEENDIRKIYNDNIRLVQKELRVTKLLGMEPEAGFEDEIKQLLGSAKYEVKESKEDEEHNYIVSVDIFPSNAKTIYYNKIYEMILGGDTRSIDEIAKEALNTAITEQQYAEKVEVQVRVQKDEDKMYQLNPEDLQHLIEGLIPYPELLFYPSGTDYGNAYYNWSMTEWQAASDEEKTNCAVTIIQKVNGFSDSQMKYLDRNNASIQESIAQIIAGINQCYESKMNIKVGDYVTLAFKTAT